MAARRFPAADCLRIDLHCHDKNSDAPDILWGRILNLPETWLNTKKLVKCLEKNNCTALTITNHNNALSCWELKEDGVDILPGAEFTCYFPEYMLFVHVLAFGFTQEQELILNEKRQNIYDFLHYAHSQDIPVILAHPLYIYTRNNTIDLALFEKMAVLFQNFEVLNGQRDLWQNMLTLKWIQGLTAEKIFGYAHKHNLDPAYFGVNPEHPKNLTGGSDDHMGIFAGQSGSYLYVPNLKQRLKTTKPSQLVLEALCLGNIVPYGHVAENQKLNIALLDYFSQVVINIKDPGLLRILFHRGEVSDKAACFIISNVLLEIQKHKTTKKFFNFIHDSLRGKKLNKLVKWNIKKDYQFCIEYLEQVANSHKQSPDTFVKTVNALISELITQLSLLIIKRLNTSLAGLKDHKLESFSTAEITKKFEVPSQLTELLFGNKSNSDYNVPKLLGNLTFPLLVSLVLLGTTLASTRALYQNRHFLNEFANDIGAGHHPRRALHLTDTLRDKNGVSSSLSNKLKEIQRANLPIDFLICHPDAQTEPHLYVTQPLTSFTIPDFGEQEIHIPDLLKIVDIFYAGGYDRIICSTEGPMALVTLFIKHMFNVPAYFFMHTDWLEFIKETTNLAQHERDRLRRILRVFYKQFAGVFVLNEDHRDWLVGHQMQLDQNKVFLTAHHIQPRNPDIKPIRKSKLFEDADEDTPILLFASRLSQEKGIFDLPKVYYQVRKVIPDLRIVIAGSGPAEDELKKQLPEALYMGWLDKQQMCELYTSLDLHVFPSRFDTFGNIILESFVHGMPVIAYNCKGPKSIIQHGKSGFLVNDIEEMISHIIQFFSDSALREHMKEQAQQRSNDYQAEPIMAKFLENLELAKTYITTSA